LATSLGELQVLLKLVEARRLALKGARPHLVQPAASSEIEQSVRVCKKKMMAHAQRISFHGRIGPFLL